MGPPLRWVVDYGYLVHVIWIDSQDLRSLKIADRAKFESNQGKTGSLMDVTGRSAVFDHRYS